MSGCDNITNNWWAQASTCATNLKIPTVIKASASTLNYGFDLSPQVLTQVISNPWAPPNAPTDYRLPWLQPGEGVNSLVVSSDGGTVTPGYVPAPTTWSDVTIVQTQIIANSANIPQSLVVAWVSGGIPGVTYELRYKWTTNSTPVQRVDERTIRVLVVLDR